ncbi:hypothetical protein F2Q69_00036152 [Brassica cretica]|uniref:Uncharacterized protein n=1 Tax=Brassica cretica TaxID=69181 RepID=A0A8S9SS79_BRACR|nr:hypothetical protein F2Q69_00036152 [Brassica cretica]
MDLASSSHHEPCLPNYLYQNKTTLDSYYRNKEKIQRDRERERSTVVVVGGRPWWWWAGEPGDGGRATLVVVRRGGDAVGERWDAPKSNGEADSSADEEQPANRRRIEVILSQQTLSSDDENDDTPVLEDLRDVLKQKFESENSNNSTCNDLRTTLNARKSRRISAVDPDPKERSNGDLRDKLNAGACDLRIRLNRSKPTL